MFYVCSPFGRKACNTVAEREARYQRALCGLQLSSKCLLQFDAGRFHWVFRSNVVQRYRAQHVAFNTHSGNVFVVPVLFSAKGIFSIYVCVLDIVSSFENGADMCSGIVCICNNSRQSFLECLSQNPLFVRQTTQSIKFDLWRRISNGKVWYEWMAEVVDAEQNHIESMIHNPNGCEYRIKL